MVDFDKLNQERIHESIVEHIINHRIEGCTEPYCVCGGSVINDNLAELAKKNTKFKRELGELGFN